MADTYDVVTLAETKSYLSIGNTSGDTNLAFMITGVSRSLDENCGPVVKRSYTAEPHRVEGCGFTVDHWPIDTVTAVTSYVGGSGTSLAAVAFGSVGVGYQLTRRTAGTGTYGGWVQLTGGAPGAQAEITYTAGRAVSTTNGVDARFKQAAFLTMKHLTNSQQISIRDVGDYVLPFGSFPATFALPNSVRDMLGDDWQGEKNRAMSPVLFG